MTSPDDPATKGFDAIVKLLDNHLSPKPLVIAERFRFHKRDQKDGESIPVYVAELRKLSEHCDFKANLNDALRYRLVCGIKHGNNQKKLLSESDLTLQKAIDIETAMETAAKDAVELQQQHRPDSVHQLSKKPTSNTKPKEKNKPCFRCDRFNHTPDECRFKEDTCRFCSKKGHIERACLSKKAQQKNQSKKKKFKPQKPQNQKITCFLLQYRNAVHTTTNVSPAKLLLGRQLRSRLDLIKPNTRDTVEKKQFESFTEPKRSQFSEGEKVMVRDYRENTNKWTDAKITEKSGPLSYKVTTGDQGTWRRHADQMVRASVEPTRTSENTSDVNLDISAPNISCESSDNSNQQPVETQPVRRYPLRNRKPPDRLTY